MSLKTDPNVNTVGKKASPQQNAIKYENLCSILDDPELAECFMTLPQEECYLNLPKNSAEESPLDLQTISENQLKDSALIARAEKYQNIYFMKNLDGHKVLCYCKDKSERQSKCQIALPDKILKNTIKWFHIISGHPGQGKLCLTMEQRYRLSVGSA